MAAQAAIDASAQVARPVATQPFLLGLIVGGATMIVNAFRS